MSVIIRKFQKKRNMLVAKKYAERWLRIIVSNKLAKTLVFFCNIVMYLNVFFGNVNRSRAFWQ